MTGRAEHDDLVLNPGFHLELGIDHLPFHQAEVDLVVQQHAGDGGRVVHLQPDAAFGVGLQEIRHDQRQQIVADGERRAHAQAAQPALAAQQGFDLGSAVEQFHRMRQQQAALVIEAQALALAIEELLVELVLELGQCRAGGGLRQRQRLGRARDVLAARDLDEDLHLAKGESHIDSIGKR